MPRSGTSGSFKAKPGGELGIIDGEPPVAATASVEDADGRQLEFGMVYTRAQLISRFAIKDATINNGVFLFRARHEIWLFVTEQKPAGRVQYKDTLIGDELHWQGQSRGRTDDPIINHIESGNDILVFYRKAKNEFLRCGFRFQGRFDYVSHSGKMPASFILRRRRLSSGGPVQMET